MGALYSTVSGLLAVISRAYLRFLSPTPQNIIIALAVVYSECDYEPRDSSPQTTKHFCLFGPAHHPTVVVQNLDRLFSTSACQSWKQKLTYLLDELTFICNTKFIFTNRGNCFTFSSLFSCSQVIE